MKPRSLLPLTTSLTLGMMILRHSRCRYCSGLPSRKLPARPALSEDHASQRMFDPEVVMAILRMKHTMKEVASLLPSVHFRRSNEVYLKLAYDLVPAVIEGSEMLLERLQKLE